MCNTINQSTMATKRKLKSKKEDFTAYKNPKQRANLEREHECFQKAREQEKTKHYKAVKAGSKTIILKEVGVSEGTKKKRLKTK